MAVAFFSLLFATLVGRRQSDRAGFGISDVRGECGGGEILPA